MYQNINQYDFVNAFERAGRGDQFSRSGLFALYDYLEEYEENVGKPYVLEVVGVCCNYCEYKTLDEIVEAYDCIDVEDAEDEEDIKEAIRDHTTLIEHDEGYIIETNF